MRPKMISSGFIVVPLLSLFLLSSGCGDMGGEGKSVNAGSRLVSSTLSSAGSAALTAGKANGNFRVAPLLASDCAAETAVRCITPDSVTGKVYYAGMIVGEPPQSGLSLGPILGYVVDPSEAPAFSTSELYDFDFSEGIKTDGAPTIGGPIPYPDDDSAYVQNAHLYFGYLDATFTLSAEDNVPAALQGAHSIRVVFADISDTSFKKGDMLYKGSNDSDYMWCTSADGCTHTARPENPVQKSDIADYMNSGEGNPTIPSFFANLSAGHEPVQLKESDMTDPGKHWVFTLDFDMENGIEFTSDPASMSDTYDLVSAFNIPAEPGSSDTGFSVTITVAEE